MSILCYYLNELRIKMHNNIKQMVNGHRDERFNEYTTI